MTETEMKIGIIGLIGLSVFQAWAIQRLARRLDYGERQFNRLQEATNYLFNIIEANDVPLTEFDVIALSAITDGRVVDATS